MTNVLAYKLISPLSIAPMIDWTYTHFRVFMRLLAPKALLYTEMQTVGAIKYNPGRALSFNRQETPLALQLGGADRHQLADCAVMAEQSGYAEVNLNLGCPSDKVLAGHFGACLMLEPAKVVDCIQAMRARIKIPVTAKMRIGVDEFDSYDFFAEFAARIIDAGCDKLIVHARKALLHGLSPKQNRCIPPLHYDYVYRLKAAFPHIPIVINGGINASPEVERHLEQVDGVMLGRLACQNPYAIALIHKQVYPNINLRLRSEILSEYFEYMQFIKHPSVSINVLLKPILNLAHSLPNARLWKAHLSRLNNVDDICIMREIVAELAIIEQMSSVESVN